VVIVKKVEELRELSSIKLSSQTRQRRTLLELLDIN